MSGTDVVQRTPAQELAAIVRGDEFQSQLALALPEGIRQERFVRSVATALLDNPDLADPEKVERGSVFQAVLKSAQDGLVPDGREAALVVYGRKAVYMPMIGGFRKIAGEHGWTIRTAVVHANDAFEYELGLEPKVRHVPVRPGEDPGDVIAAYAIGAHGDGRREVEVMARDEIEKVRQVSRAKDRGPWVDWFERMCEKTAGRRLFAKLPLGDRERIERVLDAARMEPADAAAAMYGPNGAAALAPGESVDRSTGEITSAHPLEPAEEGGHPAVSPDPQQAGEAAQVDGASGGESPSPSASSAPEDDDPEPVAAAQLDDEAAATVIPGGAYEGKTLAEVAALGPDGEEYLAWMARNAGRSSVGPVAHAALQRFRPALFEPKGA